MKALFYEYKKCSTCRNAKKWLEANNLDFKSVSIVDAPPSAQELKKYFMKSGFKIKKFFNTSGMSYRALSLSKKIDLLSLDECLALLEKDGKLIKRPLYVDKDNVLLGFDEELYSKVLL